MNTALALEDGHHVCLHRHEICLYVKEKYCKGDMTHKLAVQVPVHTQGSFPLFTRRGLRLIPVTPATGAPLLLFQVVRLCSVRPDPSSSCTSTNTGPNTLTSYFCGPSSWAGFQLFKWHTHPTHAARQRGELVWRNRVGGVRGEGGAPTTVGYLRVKLRPSGLTRQH